jgi:HSP20 family molecular chaperone IbpA
MTLPFRTLIDLAYRNTPNRFTDLANPNRIKIDIVNDENFLTVYAQIPGTEKKDVELDFYNNKLTILAESVRHYTNPIVNEIFYGRMERIIMLPICITKRESVDVSYNNGILHIRINKLVEEENRFDIRLS